MSTIFDIADGVPICGFTGPNGAGKTLLAVQSAIADMLKGRVVYSTVAIEYTARDGTVYRSRPIVSLRQLLTLSNCTILLDDVAVIFSARSTGTLPAEIVTLLQVLRHRGITLRWTAPAWMRCDNQIRDVTQAVVNVNPLRLPGMGWALRVDNGTPWPSYRQVMVGLMDTSQVKPDAAPDEFLRRKLIRPRGLRSFGAYDTHADTPQIGGRRSGGRCVDCGGSMAVEKHSKELHDRLGLPWFDDDEDGAGERGFSPVDGHVHVAFDPLSDDLVSTSARHVADEGLSSTRVQSDQEKDPGVMESAGAF